jgi:hypothetical protein
MRSITTGKACSSPTANGLGGIRADEVLPLREVSRRLGWGRKSQMLAVREGLKAVRFGHAKYCIGRDIIEFFERLADRHANSEREALP